MDFVFWGIILIWFVLIGVGRAVPALVPYGWWPTIVLFIILGYKVMGFPH